MKTILANFIAVMFIMAASATLSLPSSAMADSTLTLSEATPLLRASNYQVTSYDGAHNVPLIPFRAKCEGENTVITAVSVLIHGDTLHAKPSTVYLYDGSTLIGSTTMPTNDWLVNLAVNINIPVNTAKTLTVKADFPASTVSAVVAAEISSVVFQKTPTSSSIHFPPKMLRGPVQHLMPIAAVWTLSSVPTVTSNQNPNGTTANATATFTFNVTAMGGTIQEPGSTAKEVTVIATTADGLDKVICPTVSVLTIPHNNVSDGSTSTVTVTANLPASAVKRSGLYHFYVQQINWQSTDGSMKVGQTWGLEDFKTPNAVPYMLASTNSSITLRLPMISYNLWDNITGMAVGGEWGFPAQVASEGGFICRSPDNPNPIGYIAFPVNAPIGGTFLNVDVAMTATAMVPSVFAPNDFTGWHSDYPSTSYPVSDVVTAQYGPNGEAEKVTFKTQIADFVGYGTIFRTGENSCLVRMFWGSGATYDSPGDSLDMLDKSPSMDPPPSENKSLTAHPPRFKFGVQSYSKSGPMFSLEVNTMPGASTLQWSSDLVNWQQVPVYVQQTLADNGDSSFLLLLGIDADSLGSEESGTSRFFRLATNP